MRFTSQAPTTTTTPPPVEEEGGSGPDTTMIVGMAGGFGCFIGLIIVLCILWNFCCGRMGEKKTAKVMPMDFRSEGGKGGSGDKDSTCSRRPLTDATADCR